MCYHSLSGITGAWIKKEKWMISVNCGIPVPGSRPGNSNTLSKLMPLYMASAHGIPQKGDSVPTSLARTAGEMHMF